ncbi:MAG: SRPBCC family protein [Candidatus Koribacter versatilis]|uniref:SRPBCC family protein n=1 Tax=Candidatus Korobacter versatilis TaxID=658062 RepID=A0A932A5R2_9BACT|nr:SRPBCC family protein [Candidatus Koribacter versatilis]
MAANSSALAVTMPNDTDIQMTRVFNAPREIVFQAWTDPKHVPHWLLGPEGWTMPVCEIDLRVGGKWRYVWRKADGTEMAMSGEYREVKPPQRVVSTERWGPEWPETINTIALTEKDGKTTLSLTVHYPSKEARDSAFKTGMAGGVEVSFNRLDSYLNKMEKGTSNVR